MRAVCPNQYEPWLFVLQMNWIEDQNFFLTTRERGVGAGVYKALIAMSVSPSQELPQKTETTYPLYVGSGSVIKPVVSV